MKNLKLDFGARLQLTNMLGTVTGPLSKMAALQHVWCAVRFTDSELPQIKSIDKGGGMFIYEPPLPGWGSIEIQIEDSYASTLQQEIESYQGFRVVDIGWVDDLKEQLSAPATPNTLHALSMAKR